MPSYSQDVLEDIRSGNDLVDVVSAYVPLKQKGGNYFGLCPFHKESSPSFSVKADEQFYHCFGCGAGGNVYGFIMRIENFGFVDAVKFLADRIHYKLPEATYSTSYQKNVEDKNVLYDIHTKAARFFYDKLGSSDGLTTSLYLDKRNISGGARKKFGLGYSGVKWDELFKHLMAEGYDIDTLVKSGLVLADDKGGYHDRFRGRLMFPIFDVHNKVVGFGGRIMDDGQPKYLNSPDTPIFDKSKNLYGINFARLERAEEIIIVEGYMDVIALYQAGFRNVVAALGTAFNAEHTKILKRYCKSVILLFDSDEAGEKAALRAIPILTASGLGVKVLQLKGAKDPDEFIQKFGAESFSKALVRADSFISFQINRIKKDFDLSKTEQKVMFIRAAAEIIATLDSAVGREAYIKDIAKSTDISEQSIKEEVSKWVDKSLNNVKTPAYKNKPNIVTNKITTKGVDEAKRNILFIMATRNDIGKKISACLAAAEFCDTAYIKLYGILDDMRQRNASIYPAEVANHFETVEEQQMVSNIFAVQFKYETENELIAAVNDQIGLIKRAYVDFMISNEHELEKLQKLVEIKRNMANTAQKQYISF